MKILAVVLALIVAPLLMSFFQNSQFENRLKSALHDEAMSVLQQNGVDVPRVDLSKFDATIGGVVESLEMREMMADKVSAVGGPGALRVKPENNRLRVYGYLDIQKKGTQLFLSGRVDHIASSLLSLSSVDKFRFVHTGDLQENKHFIDAPVLESPTFNKWVSDYFSLDGERRIRLSAKGSVVTIYGEITQSILKKFKEQGAKGQFDVVLGSDMASAYPTRLTISRKNGEFKLSGNVAEGFDLSKIGFSDVEHIKFDPFVGDSSLIGSEAFQAWIGRYFRTDGDRSFEIVGETVFFQGEATTFMKEKWAGELSVLGLESNDNGLDFYPSRYHFPSYAPVAGPDQDSVSQIYAILKENQIFFDVESSEIHESELKKVDILASAIKTSKSDFTYVIGGYADKSGNMQINQILGKQRANSVAAQLRKRGVELKKLDVIAFGETFVESISEAADRRVEILLK